MSRILCIDFGDVRVGLAISDPMRIIAKPYKTIQNTSVENVVQKINNEIIEKGIETLVVGLPKNMDGSEGFQAKKTRNFFKNNRLNCQNIIFWDEQLSSKKAEEILYKLGKDSKEQRNIKDQYAACVILEDYLKYGG